MGRKFLYLVLILVLAVGGYYAYQHYKQNQMEADGDVQCVGCLTPAQEAAFKKENAGEAAEGQSDRKAQSASQGNATTQQNGPAATAAVSGTTTYPAPANGTTATASRGSFPAAAPASNMPVSDSQGPNAPNGMRFGGTGGYEWYRQGNLTWRVNTQTGSSCIVYATMEEWRKSIVMQHGCGRDS